MLRKLLTLSLMGVLVAPSGAAPQPSCPPAPMVREMTIDLNGDGRPDTITLQTEPETSSFTLRVNEAVVTGFLGSSPTDSDFEPDGFCVVDVDVADAYKEIAVHSPGPSDDDVYLLYWYDGRTLHRMGKLSRWPKFSGNGIVLVDDWLGFWAKRDKYVLNRANRTLEGVPQEFYYVGVQATAKESFPLYRKRGGKAVVAHPAINSKIDLLVCDCSPAGDASRHWYLIKTASGLVGWARWEDFLTKVSDLPLAD